jgi:pyruvate formate lyase activating enzyme
MAFKNIINFSSEKNIGLIFNIQRYSLHDGPGIRTVVFVKGCPLRCIWCDNPEGQRAYPEIVYFKERCIRCKACLKICPENALMIKDDEVKEVIRSKCTICGKCLDVCPSNALQRIGDYMTVNEVLGKVEKDSMFYQHSGGGITISGGEPTTQPEFVAELLKRCKEKHIHTAIETSGYTKWENMEKILGYVDLVLYDLKTMDPKKHKKFTGVSNELILENAMKISILQIPMVIRIPFIPTYNDNEENIRATALFARKLNVVKEIDLLPYHRFGESKYGILGRKYKLRGLQPPPQEQVYTAKKIIESYGFKVNIGG